MDKAGAYGLQDESQDFIERVEGSVTNVIGLPMERLSDILSTMVGAT
jgi:septum formation protein